jgi:thiol:disulfide interchange protein DsbG
MSAKIAVLVCAAAVQLPLQAQGNGAMPLVLRDGISQAPSRPTPPREPQHEDSSMPPAPAAFDQAAVIEHYGKVVDRRQLGAGGLTAWTVEKNGRRVVLYTTADGQAIISGVVWESASGRNLSESFVSRAFPPVPPQADAAAALHQPSASVSGASAAALVGPYSGTIPESIKAIDSLAGIKEGHGGPTETLYVIFDPRCPYCRQAYNITRPYVQHGFTIKWIPTLALGNTVQGLGFAATVIQAKPSEQAEMLHRVLGNKEEINSAPTQATQEALARNLSFFYAAFKNKGASQPGVPAAFFLDKHTGQPRMMTGISELPVVEAVFGKLP